eukprot:6205708-Pleurochrysis_carterae.AAC.3
MKSTSKRVDRQRKCLGRDSFEYNAVAVPPRAPRARLARSHSLATAGACFAAWASCASERAAGASQPRTGSSDERRLALSDR